MELKNKLDNLQKELEKIKMDPKSFKSKGKGKGLVFGKVNRFGTSAKNYGYFGDSTNNIKYNIIYDILLDLSNYLNFECTTFQINHNFKTQPHYDKNNIGNTLIIAFGDYDGGELNVNINNEIEIIDIKYKQYIFDGSNNLHWTNDFIGNRYSLMFFNTKKIRSHTEKN